MEISVLNFASVSSQNRPTDRVKPIKTTRAAVFDGADFGAHGWAPCSPCLLLIAGQPLHEPIAQWGSFVMNRREEIEAALADYRAGRF